jgi:hypothetical protein
VVPLYGGAPRSVLPDVSEADWHPSGSQLAVVREVGGWNRLEYPVGRVLYQTSGWIGDLRFSPRGDRIAFSLHPTRDDDRGRVVTVDLSGKVEPLSEDLESIEGLAWTKDASEVWYAASDTGYADVVYAAAPGKAARVVTRFPVPIKLLDLGSGNKLLFATRDDDQETTWAKLPDSEQERNLDWLGSGYPADLSQDGTLLLYTQYGQAGGANYSVYIRKLGDAMPIRLGQGDGIALSLPTDGTRSPCSMENPKGSPSTSTRQPRRSYFQPGASPINRAGSGSRIRGVSFSKPARMAARAACGFRRPRPARRRP